MLVLTRKEGQSFVLDAKLVVRVLEISGNKVRIGIEAPSDILIVRSELMATTQDRDRVAAAE
jgi:carbon storage regulator